MPSGPRIHQRHASTTIEAALTKATDRGHTFVPRHRRLDDKMPPPTVNKVRYRYKIGRRTVREREAEQHAPVFFATCLNPLCARSIIVMHDGRADGMALASSCATD